MDKTYKQIKRSHGEAFARAMREACPRALEAPELPRILRHAGCAVTPALVRLVRAGVTVAEQPAPPELPPWRELAEQAGYTVTDIRTRDDQRPFARYYLAPADSCGYRPALERVEDGLAVGMAFDGWLRDCDRIAEAPSWRRMFHGNRCAHAFLASRFRMGGRPRTLNRLPRQR